MTAPSTAFSPSLRDLWRRTRGPLAFVLDAVGIAALVAVSSPTRHVGHLDPEAVTGQGSRALAQILRKRGADVTVARSVDAAAAAAGPDTVLLVVRSHELRPDDVARLTDLPGDQLLVQPTPDLLEAAAPGVEVAASSLPAEPLEPDALHHPGHLRPAHDRPQVLPVHELPDARARLPGRGPAAQTAAGIPSARGVRVGNACPPSSLSS